MFPETGRTVCLQGLAMLPKTSEYALRAVACLARDPDEPLSAEELAAQTKVPRRYLHKVLQDLVRAELIQSRPGPGGGYSLQTPAEEITILAVVNAVAPLERIRHCPLGLPSHTRLCPLHKELDRAYAATEAAFARVTIGELMRSGDDVVPLCELSRC
jgi:Rrf2 family protein